MERVLFALCHYHSLHRTRHYICFTPSRAFCLLIMLNKYRSGHWRALQCRITLIWDSELIWVFRSFKINQINTLFINLWKHMLLLMIHVSSPLESSFSLTPILCRRQVFVVTDKTFPHVCNHGSHREEKKKILFSDLVLTKKIKNKRSQQRQFCSPLHEQSWANLPRTSLTQPCCHGIRSASILLH